jgi:O-antigen/teichoic acid export membrane protein
MLINLAATLVLARLLAPQEYGVTVIGGAVFAIAEALRALGGGAYLIQKPELSKEDIRACFTVSLASTIAVAALLMLLAHTMARFFTMPRLEHYLRIAAIGYLAGPFIYPIAALMSRDLAFGALALISVVTAGVNAGVCIGLALQGYGYMSFAWAGAVSTATCMLLYLYCWKDRTIFKPIFRRWQSVLRFGIFDSATALVLQVADALPFFIFGKLFGASVVGLSQRVLMLCLVPERVILAGVGAVALPAFSQQARDGKSLKPAYLRAIELITAAQWPSLLLLVLLAKPLVATLLGPQWMETVPYVRIVAGALLFSFPLTLYYPTIVAVGAIRYMPLIFTLQSIASLSVLVLAARHGLYPAALSTFVIFPWNGLLSLGLARRFIRFRWADVLIAIRGSMLVAATSSVGPAAMLAIYANRDMSVGATAAALSLSAIGWFAGLKYTRHPLFEEIGRLNFALRARLSRAMQ